MFLVKAKVGSESVCHSEAKDKGGGKKDSLSVPWRIVAGCFWYGSRVPYLLWLTSLCNSLFLSTI
jgi:hypothetical protein